ncbi:MAG: MaoC family dehydratase [Chloroflexota bacterium]
MALNVGTSLPELKRRVAQERINLYARASGDFNPIHLDPDFARKTPLGSTIAHGMLILAYLSEMLTGAFGRDWLGSGSLDIRFKAPARPGDTITAGGKITGIQPEDGSRIITLEVLCRNQQDEPVITGSAKVRVPA